MARRPDTSARAALGRRRGGPVTLDEQVSAFLAVTNHLAGIAWYLRELELGHLDLATVVVEIGHEARGAERELEAGRL